ncbi:hypothetical protein [Pontibacter ruber]|uniref:STAS/SEC14 domain-containing protein n=1 Tax=Pontibacter ruber TaxID=1343895 RepID=A0ABW5CS91_9BACT|nr:hypothetical protein [Pontibacter ruber]
MLPDIFPEPVLKDEILHIELNKELSCIYLKWHSHPSSQDFRHLYKQAADLAHEHKCRYWLSDARALHFLEFADQNWLLRELVPRLITSPLLKYARITTQESLAMFDVQRICDSIEAAPELAGIKTQIQVFLDPETAIDWLFCGD